jgi:hypothetical protein
MQGWPWLSALASLFDYPCRMTASEHHAGVRMQSICRHTQQPLSVAQAWIHAVIAAAGVTPAATAPALQLHPPGLLQQQYSLLCIHLD